MSINGNQLFVCSVEMRVKNQLSGRLDRKTDHIAGAGNMVILSFNNTPPASRWISAPRGVAHFNSIEFEGIVRADHYAGVGKMITLDLKNPAHASHWSSALRWVNLH